ncbi:alpha/beta fold hydrolase [Catenulispora subtropica]|uniref:Alpha/beta hydrolase n=1 Tax=Catenulispora subtropica TaxID=450798 RepID=A0ABN2RTB5_9ACTN
MSDLNAPAEQPVPLGRSFAVQGRKLLAYSAGTAARPPVVLLPGGGSVGLDLWPVLDGVGQFATAITYDRGGTGWSDREVRLPRSLAAVTEELLELLRVADVAGPYIFVGHSLGGFYARYLAARHPEHVAGMVLLETGHEDLRKYMPKELTDRWDAFDPDQELPDVLPQEVADFYRGLFEQEMTAWPAEIREPLIANHVHPDWLRVGMREAANISALNDEMRAAGPAPAELPMISLTAMDIDPFKRAVSMGVSDELLQAETEAKLRLYDELAATFTRGENRRIAGVGHATLPMRRPDAVVQAVRDLMAR